MKTQNSALASALKTLLEEKLPQTEADSLKEQGFTLKKPTRKAALAIAIYKKAVSGDLSAIKELCNILKEDNTSKITGKAVMIVDDI